MGSNSLRKGLVILIVFAMLFAMCLVNLSTAQALPGSEDTAVSSANQRVDVLIGFYHAPGPSERVLVRSHGGEISRQFSIVDVIAASMTQQAADALAQNPRVRYVEPDSPVYAISQTVPWGIDRVFGDESYPFNTWEITRGDGIAVAILDTGIDETHEDLPGLLGGVNTVDSTHFGSDGHGHGTHVAGTVAALDNNKGVVGVGPVIGLYAVKVLDDSGSGSVASVVGGIEWAVQQGIPVLNMSLGSTEDSTTMEDACGAAYAAGHLLVAAAGNSGNLMGRGDNVIYPAKYESVMAVAASTSSDSRAFFSSTGPAVELIAPGNSILSTTPEDKYDTKSGTSMASPHAAGAAALAWAANPGLTNVELRTILQNTAEDLGLSANHQGYGLVRADEAVKAVAVVAPPVTYTITATAGTGGKIEPSGEVVVNEGDSQTFTITADTGYKIDNVVVDGSSEGAVSTYTFENVSANHTINTTFAEVTEADMVRVKSITYSTSGGRFNDRHLDIKLLLLDDQGNPVSNASVSATLTRDDGSSWNYQGTTGSDGTVTFSLNNHGSGSYETKVTAVEAEGLKWDGLTPDNSHLK
jgi:subtilisin